MVSPSPRAKASVAVISFREGGEVFVYFGPLRIHFMLSHQDPHNGFF